MIDFDFKLSINDRPVSEEQAEDALYEAFLQDVVSQIMQKIGHLIDPETGKPLTVKIHDDGSGNPQVVLEGSDDILAEAKKILEIEE